MWGESKNIETRHALLGRPNTFALTFLAPNHWLTRKTAQEIGRRRIL